MIGNLINKIIHNWVSVGVMHIGRIYILFLYLNLFLGHNGGCVCLVVAPGRGTPLLEAIT